MTASRTRRHSQAVATKTAEIAWAAPQVVAHRMARMAAAGANPSARDRQEFQRMGLEKLAAFNESWTAMALQAVQAQQVWAATVWRACWSPWLAVDLPAHMAGQWQRSAMGMLDKGLAPVHRRATANARRLSRTR